MFRGAGTLFVAWLAAGCARPPDTGVELTPSTASTADPSVCERLLRRALEPRAIVDEPSLPACAGAMPACAGAGLFAARLPLESFRRDRAARGPVRRF
jgi:hypothetical protein